MTYNFDNHAYELTLMLKQGYYNYEYVIRKNNQQIADQGYFEGNHYETENDYCILVYHSCLSRIQVTRIQNETYLYQTVKTVASSTL